MNVAGVIAYRVTVAYEHPEGVAYRVSSDTDGRVTWHRVEGATCGQVTECSAEGVEDGEWIITPAGVWTFVAGDWVNVDPSDPGTGWAMALAPWQLSEPRTIYGQVYEVFAELEPQRWIEVEGGEAIVYSGGADTVAHFFGEDAGDVESGRLEVWMDPTGFPLRVIADTTEVRDLSLPAMYDWSLSDLGAIDIETRSSLPRPAPCQYWCGWRRTPVRAWIRTARHAKRSPRSLEMDGGRSGLPGEIPRAEHFPLRLSIPCGQSSTTSTLHNSEPSSPTASALPTHGSTRRRSCCFPPSPPPRRSLRARARTIPNSPHTAKHSSSSHYCPSNRTRPPP